VEVEWPIDPALNGEARIERREPDSSFGLVTTLPLLGTGQVRFVDENVSPGTSYVYRAGLLYGSQWAWSNELDAVTPSGPGPPITYVLAFSQGTSLLAQGSVDVAFTVPAAGRARVDAFDVRGHHVASASVEAAQAGPYALRLAASGDLRPGMYFLRLGQGSAFAQSRVILLGR
jgi:hypothetical protein